MTSEYPESQLEYQRRFYRTKFKEYLGVCVCERCGENGYAYLKQVVNTKTNRGLTTFLQISHQHTEHGKTKYDGCCYIRKVT